MIYFEIIPLENERSALRLYNLGGGSQYNQSYLVGNKIKFVPYQEWQDIANDKLLDRDFWTSFYQLQQTQTPQKYRTNYNEQDINGALHCFLGPATVTTFDNPKILMTVQNTGICAMRSLLAFFRTRLEEALGDEGYQIYKRIKCDLTVQSLIDLKEMQPKGPFAEQRWRLIQKSYQKLCRRIEKLRSKNIIGDAYLLSTSKYLQEIHAWIKEGHRGFCVAKKPFIWDRREELDLKDFKNLCGGPIKRKF